MNFINLNNLINSCIILQEVNKMLKIKFDEYKENKQYLLLFDVLIKKEHNNKDLFLEDIDITPSSYRRAKSTEQNIGKNIVDKLCEYFNIKKVSVEEVEKYQIYLNKIYFLNIPLPCN